jgi:hypothetical protein
MGTVMLTEAEVDALPPEKRLDECPLCGCKKHEGHQRVVGQFGFLQGKGGGAYDLA